jgi:hypothetical protein
MRLCNYGVLSLPAYFCPTHGTICHMSYTRMRAVLRSPVSWCRSTKRAGLPSSRRRPEYCHHPKEVHDLQTRTYCRGVRPTDISSVCVRQKDQNTHGNKSLSFLKRCVITSNRVARWMVMIQEYDLDIVHIAGCKNDFAHALSRNPAGLTPSKSTP